jgi:hypothetical protein
MKGLFPLKKSTLKLIVSCCFALLFLFACTPRTDLVKTGVAEVVLLPSKTHELCQVRAYQEESEFVVYGKVEETAGFCITPGHVDMAVVSKDGELLHAVGIPYVNRGNRRIGWLGAHFRARLPGKIPDGATIRLAFHGDACYPGTTFPEADNRASPK